jgi:1-acyl-sn-glycerol-3-phosphate acyltransferase
MGLHLFRGLLILTLRYPRLSPLQRGALCRRWSGKMLDVFAIELRISGSVPQPDAHNTLLVCNHISWLDVIVLASCCTTRYIAKKEIRRWPLIGWMTELGGTLFIDRGNRRDASRMNRHMAHALQGGDCLTVFPEGTTTDGHHLLPFKSSLFESAIMATSTVQPVAIRYLDQQGGITSAPSYAGNTTLWQSLCGLLRLRKIIVELHFCKPLHTEGAHFHSRFALSAAARHEIERAFTPATDRPGTAAKSPAGPPVAAR